VSRTRGPGRREPRYVETEEYVAFVHRILAALGRRVADADVAMLRALADLGRVVDELLADTVRRLREHHGYSWADIGRELGITKQSAHERFGRQGGPDGPARRAPRSGS
jgi:hypothetical protein